jgi:HKD family nuclease
MALCIQDPESPIAPSLHESLLAACRGAIHGGGVFAFVTREGCELLLRDEVFSDLATTGTFNLIIGVDEVTNVRALETLREFGEELPGLTVRVFLHDLSGAIFHPKFCWFRHATGGILVTGSGNLTARGLRSNWEAFTVTRLNPREIDEIEQLWNNWTTIHNNFLRPLDDEEVLEQAARNIRRPARRGTRRTRTPRRRDVVVDQSVDSFEPPHISADILIAEIPRASTRWNQANFDLDNFQNFFGMRIGNTQLRAILQHVDSNGTLGPLESRPGVSVRSRNFRLELQAAAGLEYPDENRPIGVFVRVASRTFRYRLLMPDDRDYGIVSEFLDNNWAGPSNRVRRVITTVNDLRQVWPTSPLWVVV